MASKRGNNITVQIGAKMTDLEKELKKINRKLEGFRRSTQYNTRQASKHWKSHSKAVESSVSRMHKGLTGLAALITTFSSLRGLSSMRKTLDEIGKSATAVGVSTTELQKFQVALEISGIEGSKAEKIYAKIAQNSVYASQGLATYTRIFDYFKINVKDGNGNLKNTRSLLLELADGYKNASNQSEAFGYLTQLLGARMARVAVVLGQGAEGIKALEQQAEESGAIIDEKLIETMQELNDELLVIKKSLIANLANPAVQAAKAVNQLFEVLNKVTKLGSKVGKGFGPWMKFMKHRYGGMSSFGGDGSGPGAYGEFDWEGAGGGQVTLPPVAVTADKPINMKAAEEFFMSAKQARESIAKRDIAPIVKGMQEVNRIIEAGLSPAQKRARQEEMITRLLIMILVSSEIMLAAMLRTASLALVVPVISP